MKVFRGQAFETMMLVISVIVAIAILGALLGILGGLGTIGSGESKTAINGMVKALDQRGVGIETKQNVEFSPGSALAAELVIGTSVQPTYIKIYCTKTPATQNGALASLCGGLISSPVSVSTPATITVANTSTYDIKKKGSGTISVIKQADSPYYIVCIGDKESPSNTITYCKSCTFTATTATCP